MNRKMEITITVANMTEELMGLDADEKIEFAVRFHEQISGVYALSEMDAYRAQLSRYGIAATIYQALDQTGLVPDDMKIESVVDQNEYVDAQRVLEAVEYELKIADDLYD